MGILKNTIQGLPTAAARLGRDAYNIVGGAGLAGYGATQPGVQMARNGAKDMVGAFQGRMPSYKKGGMVKKTGLAKLHKGEYVMTKAKVKAKGRALDKMKNGRIATMTDRKKDPYLSSDSRVWNKK